MSHDIDKISKPEEYIRVVKDRGLSEIGFSDHFAVKKASKIDYSMDYEELKKYVAAIQKLKGSVDFPIKLGLEMDFFPGLEKRIDKILKSYAFDYVIGSVHFIKEWPVDNPLSIPDYKKSNINKLYEEYFNLVKQAIESRLFDTIGHIDLIKIFGFKPKNDITNLLENVADALKENKVCVEVNTRGMSKPCKEIYPSEKLLKICFDKGVKVTLGSDAHNTEEVGRYFDNAIKLLKEIGYEKIARFTKREMTLVKI
jgi:histidinol-phosphatase (PHP family)